MVNFTDGDEDDTFSSYKNTCLLAFICYVVLAVTLTKWPCWLHSRVRKPKFEARHISHRGGAGEMPENTICAFRHSLEVGTDMFELDCHLTKDGHVVVCHDENLKRVCGVDVDIADLNYAELPKLKRSIEVDFAPACFTKVPNDESNDCRIPKLEDVFAAFPNTPMNIDIKMDNDEMIQQVARLVEKYRRESITVWGSRSGTVRRKCAETNANILRFYPFSEVMKILVLYYIGLLPFMPLKDSCIELPARTQYLFPNIGQHLSFFKRLVSRFGDLVLLNRSLFRHLYERGVHTYFWVVNDEASFQRAFDLGAVGVMTDYPSRLREYLDRNPQNSAGSPKLRNLRNGMH